MPPHNSFLVIMKVQHSLIPMGALLLLSVVPAMAETPASPPRVAIFTANQAEAELNDLLPAFEDFLAASVAELGYQVVSREVALGAVSDLEQTDRKNDLDALLEEQSSALRLSRNLGAGYILYATIDGLVRETRTVQAYDVDYRNDIFTLQATYRILDGSSGAALAGGVVNPQRTIQQSQHSQTSTNGLTRQLLQEAGRAIAVSLAASGGADSLPAVSLEQKETRFTINVRLDEMAFPEVSMDPDGQPRVTANRIGVQPTAVSVEVDGILVGTTANDDKTASFPASPGLHRLRLSRGDLEPVDRMVNIRDGLNLNVSMRLNEDGRRQWLENTGLLQELKSGTRLTEAQAEALRGLAQMLRQSGFRIDTEEGVIIERNQNLMHQN